MNLQRFDSRGELLDALGRDMLERLQQALAVRGRALLALSGGRTPLPLYAHLAAAEIDWKRVCFALVDERWVATDAESSNEAQLRRALASALAAGAEFSGMKNAAASVHDGLADCESAYQGLALPFDLLLLGMGDDGHTASLFPHAEGLATALAADSPRRCAAIIARPSEVTGKLLERMTLNASSLLAAQRIDLLITGERKLQVLEAAMAAGSTEQMPVRIVLRQDRTPVHVWWSP